MQHLNDDMDELFRRAGKDYPLNTNGADWEKIAGRLNATGTEIVASKNDRRKLLWLLLLLPFSFICTQYFANEEGAKLAEAESAADLSSGHAEKENRGVKNKNTVAPVNTLSYGKELTKAKEIDEYNANHASVVALPYKTKSDAVKTVWEKDNSGWKDFNPEVVAAQEKEVFFRRHEAFGVAGKFSSGFLPFSLAEHKKIVGVESKKKDEPKTAKKFYAGLMGGVDATSIKFQKIENAGYDVGVLLGYNIHKKWSIESGIFNSRKFYYSKGQYFNTSKIYMPPNSKISSVEGNCTMWEVPVNVRYNPRSSAGRSWFVTAGVSSYFMRKEDYDYVYYYPATGQSYERQRYYNNASKHYFAVAQFSAGYTHQVGKLGDLRLEPYVKIPLKGVGIGSLPLHSVGLHVGITRKIF